MASRLSSLFGSTRYIENELNEFLDAISQGALVFQAGVAAYLAGQDEQFTAKVAQLDELEGRGDDLKRKIQTELYTEMLVPESRGDILHLLRFLDELLDAMKSKLEMLEITRAEVPNDYHGDFKQLVTEAVNCVQSTVLAARSYFRDIQTVRDHVQKASFYESEADAAEKRLLRAVYSSDLPLERKMMLREGVEFVGFLADAAEDCADRLLIYSIKRAL